MAVPGKGGRTLTAAQPGARGSYTTQKQLSQVRKLCLPGPKVPYTLCMHIVSKNILYTYVECIIYYDTLLSRGKLNRATEITLEGE